MATFDIIFRGDLLPGFQLADVKRNLASLFKTDGARIDALFTGGAVPLKRDLDESTAQKYLAVLKKAGAEVQLAAAGSVGASRRRPAPTSAPVAPAAAQQVDPAARSQAAPPETPAAVPPSATDWSLAPVGVTLVEAVAQPAPAVPDIGHLSLRAQAGNLVDDSEIARPLPVAVAELEVDLREVGASLLDESERSVPVAAEVAELVVDLAPAGSDLGQIRRPEPPPAPDTSGLQLLDN